LLSRTVGPLSDLTSQIQSAGGRATFKPVDVTDSVAFAQVVEETAEKLGRLDILINNAGMTKDGLVLRMSDDDWASVIQTNLTSAFVAIRAATRFMMKQRFGRIVNIASTSGVIGNAGQANYAAAVSYVASDDAGFLTGQVICVDGGMTMC